MQVVDDSSQGGFLGWEVVALVVIESGAEGGEDGLGCVGSSFADRGEGAGGDGCGGGAQDRGQGMADAAGVGGSCRRVSVVGRDDRAGTVLSQ